MTSELTFPDNYNVGEWLQSNGPDADIAVCTRVRFARNVKGYRFSTCMPEQEAQELTAYLRTQLAGDATGESLRILELDTLDELERGVLLERHLISRELANAERSRFVAVNESESVSVMVNEEDHIRAQLFQAGHAIEEAYDRAERFDEALMHRVDMAFSEEFGFLTACPTNTGTGLRVSVMLHLPGLVWAEEIEKATTAFQKISMAVRGLYGEGSRASGDFYQVSNQITLGRSERQIAQDVGEAVRALIDWERKVRSALLSGDSQKRTQDRIYRSLGTLERARILTTDEALTCLSALRFGIQQGLVDDISMEQANIALLLSQPAHLQRLCGTTLPPAQRDERRAELMRDLMRRR